MVYPGAKNILSRVIINQIPPHRVYVEPFLGSGVIMQTKLPAWANIGIDRNPLMVAEAQLYMSALPAGVALEADSIAWLKAYQFQGDEFVYGDPPYVRSARRSGRDIYAFEMTDDDHVALLDVLCSLPCPVMLSGYASELYDSRLSGWRRLEVDVMGHVGMNTEVLWMNYPEPIELHDYRFLGDNRTDRQRIKRKKERWLAKLRSMPVLERRAILWALSELVEDSQECLQDIVDVVDCDYVGHVARNDCISGVVDGSVCAGQCGQECLHLPAAVVGSDYSSSTK